MSLQCANEQRKKCCKLNPETCHCGASRCVKHETTRQREAEKCGKMRGSCVECASALPSQPRATRLRRIQSESCTHMLQRAARSCASCLELKRRKIKDSHIDTVGSKLFQIVSQSASSPPRNMPHADDPDRAPLAVTMILGPRTQSPQCQGTITLGPLHSAPNMECTRKELSLSVRRASSFFLAVRPYNAAQSYVSFSPPAAHTYYKNFAQRTRHRSLHKKQSFSV